MPRAAPSPGGQSCSRGHLLLLQDSAGEPLYKLFKAIKHQVEKGPVDAVQKKAKYTLNDTGLLGDDVEYVPLVSPGLVPCQGLGLHLLSDGMTQSIED